MITSMVGRLIKKPELVERIHIPGKKVVAFTLVQNSQRGEKRLSVFFNLSMVLATEAQYELVMGFDKGTVLLFSSPRITYVKQVERDEHEQVINLYAEVDNFRIVVGPTPTATSAASVFVTPDQQQQQHAGGEFGDDDVPADVPSFGLAEQLSDPFEGEEAPAPPPPLTRPRSSTAGRAAGSRTTTANVAMPPSAAEPSAAVAVPRQEQNENDSAPPDVLVALEGNTYGIRAELKALGAIWDGKTRGWRIAPEKAAQARALIDSQPQPELVKEGGAAAAQPRERGSEAGDELPDPFEEEAEPLVALTGNSYAVKDALRALGARWDKEQRAWVIRKSKAARAQALIDAAAAAPDAAAAAAAAGVAAVAGHRAEEVADEL